MKGLPEGIPYLCKYFVSDFIIMNKDHRIEMDFSNIISIEYIGDYENSLFAILKVVLRIDIRKRLYILEHKNDIQAHFELSKFPSDIDIEETMGGLSEAWNEVFNVYLNDEDDMHDVELLQTRLDSNEAGDGGGDPSIENTEEENYFETQNTIELYLFNPELLKASRYSYNQIYTETTLQWAIGEILTATGHKDVLMSRIENTEIYKELLLPPKPAYELLIYLDQHYGLYRKGAIIYYDIDLLYILNTNGKVTAKRKKEWTETTFLIPNIEESIPGDGMLKVEDEEIFYPVVGEVSLTINKASTMKNVDMGSKMKIVRVDSIEIENYEADQSYIDKKNTNVSFLKEDNKYTGEIMEARMEENEAIIHIHGSNFDVNAFTPNKTFRIVHCDPSKNAKFHGEYRLAYAYHLIKAASENYMESSHHIVLKKTK